MNTSELNAVVDETLKELRQLLTVKGGEYSSNHDRLINFKRGAALTGVKPLTVLLVYLSKHYDAFCTFVRDQQTGENRPRSEAIKGRLHDLINYCILAIALLEEAEQEARPKDKVKADTRAHLNIMAKSGAVFTLFGQEAEAAHAQLLRAPAGLTLAYKSHPVAKWDFQSGTP